jgi:hypothetical protein
MLRCAAVVAVVCATVAVHAAPPRYDVSVRVDAEARHVEGHVRIVVDNDMAAPQNELWLWRFPERFATRSPALNDYNFYWIYPYRFNPGHMRTSAVVVDGRAAAVEVRDHPRAGKGTLLHVALDPPLAPGASTTVDVDFSVDVPTRYGAFGCIHGDCTLTGFHPMVAPIGSDGADALDAMPGRGRYRLSIAVHDVSDVVVNGVLRALERGRRLDFDVGDAEGLTLMVERPHLRQFEKIVRGIRIVYLSPMGRGLPSPPENVLPYQPANRVDRVLDAASDAVELLFELGVTLPAGEEVRIVGGPLRIELAQALPGVVLVSDQLFDIFPLQRFLKFHEFELARAIYEAWIARRTLAAERADDRGWAPGAGASYLVDLYTLRSYRKTEFAREILAWASFIPAIDRVMYAPQVPFASRIPIRCATICSSSTTRARREKRSTPSCAIFSAPRRSTSSRARSSAASRCVPPRKRCAASRSIGSGSSGSAPIPRSTIASPTSTRSAPASTRSATSRASSRSARRRPSSPSRCAPPIAKATLPIKPGTASAASTPTSSRWPRRCRSSRSIRAAGSSRICRIPTTT